MERSVTSQWRKATYSGSNGGACVEVGKRSASIAVRDTTNRAAGHIEFSGQAWAEFVASVK